jgi:hypothetical protein
MSERMIRMPNTEGVDLVLVAPNGMVTFFLSAIRSAGIGYSTAKKRIPVRDCGVSGVGRRTKSISCSGPPLD